MSPRTQQPPAEALTDNAVAKQDWHHTIDMSTRRTVLLHILVLLKTKYGKVDAKISYIGRRAELALYSQAFSAWEYWNPQTLSRRLHSLVVKLHLNNLAEKEEAAFAKDQQARVLAVGLPSAADDLVTLSRTKRKSDASEQVMASSKRRRTVSGEANELRSATTSNSNSNAQAALFFEGNADLVQLLSVFLDTSELLRCAATCTAAAQQFPAFVTKIEVTANALKLLSVSERARMFRRFANLETFTLNGQVEAQRFDFQDETTIVARNVLVRSVLQSLSEARLPKLCALGLNYCYSEGLQDQITRQVASTLVGPDSRFPQLQVLSLAGNCISDDGATHLYDALLLPRQSQSPSSPLAAVRLLNLEQNFIGERGHVLMQELFSHYAANDAVLLVNLRGNLLAPAASAATAESSA
jgi:hypothetical protein